MNRNERDNLFNLSKYKDYIDDHEHEVRPFLNFPQFFWDAIREPGKRFAYSWKENGYEYENYALFDNETMIMHTNYPACPNRDHHHINCKCPVCGSN